jgi:hypothetical protein
VPQQRSAAPSTTAIRSALIGFERWYARHLADDSHEHLSVTDSIALLTVLFDRSRGALLVPAADTLEDLLAAVDGDPAIAPRILDVIDTLEHYLDFAVETGAWEATDAQIDDSSEVLDVAFEVTTGLLVVLIDSLDEIDDVPAEIERVAFETLAVPVRSPDQLTAHLRTVLGRIDPLSAPAAVAVERVLAALAVAAEPDLLPGRSEERIRGMIDAASGVSPEEAVAADAATDRMLERLVTDGILRLPESAEVARHEAPFGLRPALADAVIEIADELGLLDDEGFNPHPEGTALQLKVSAVDSKPAEWRRLLLAADSDLGELHLAVQLGFDWPNTEPHEFTLEAEPGLVFTSIDRVGDEGAHPDSRRDAADENDVQLGELFQEVGDEVSYRYGADEPRRLVMRLEAIAESAGRALPRCVGASDGVDLEEADRLLAPLRLR